VPVAGRVFRIGTCDIRQHGRQVVGGDQAVADEQDAERSLWWGRGGVGHYLLMVAFQLGESPVLPWPVLNGQSRQ
jgi:hypothetical protein